MTQAQAPLPLAAGTGQGPAATGRVPPVLLLGPTASGKTAVGLALAKRFDLEIVSVDSAQVYRGLDIGTAKPGVDERSRVPHHLIDLREPQQSYSAAAFVTDAARVIAEIQARGRLPLLVGGTMLYARALLAPLDDLPAADPALREQLDAEARRLGWPALHARLRTLDPAAAERIRPGDSQRIQRALEVILLTGRPLSDLQRSAPTPTARAAATAASGWTVLAIEPSDRRVLHARIAERFDAMLAAGFIDEVRALLTQPGIDRNLPAMRAVGYRQIAEWLTAGGPSIEPVGAMRERGIAATRQLAKRQLTWLRSWPVSARFDCLSATLTDQVGDAVARVVEASRRHGA